MASVRKRLPMAIGIAWLIATPAFGADPSILPFPSYVRGPDGGVITEPAYPVTEYSGRWYPPSTPFNSAIEAPITPAAPAWSWTGFYLGAHVGSGWGYESFNSTFVNPRAAGASSGTENSSGWLGGGQIGINYEFAAPWVIGVEADGDWANISGSTSSCSTYTTGALVGFTSGCATKQVTLNDFGTVRGRVGYVYENALFYGTAGWAWGDSSGTHVATCEGVFCPAESTAFSGGAASFSNSLSGWAAGAGIEWRFLPNWTLRAEYLHLEFDNVTTSFATAVTTILGTTPVTHTISSNNGIDIARVGFSYLFSFGPTLWERP
jgi:outer membrane immunogenic protein